MNRGEAMFQRAIRRRGGSAIAVNACSPAALVLAALVGASAGRLHARHGVNPKSKHKHGLMLATTSEGGTLLLRDVGGDDTLTIPYNKSGLA